MPGPDGVGARALGFNLVVFVVQMVVFVVAMVPILGWLVYLLSFFILLPAILYGLYALFAEDLSVSAALGRVWAGITRRFEEHFLAGLVLVGFGLALWLVSLVLALIPMVGWMAAALFFLVGAGFLPVYCGLRYQLNVRPYLEEQGPPATPFPQGPTA
nr:MAG: hypothetical protein DIU70_13780 [Bacillota bacterium]